jgi:threonyl-tRNA synthetase
MVNYKVIVVDDSVETYATQVFLQMLELGLNVEMDIEYQDTLQSRILSHKNDIDLSALNVA